MSEQKMATKHPCEGMTTAQRNAFEQIAVNQAPQCRWETIDTLIERGLIVKHEGEKRRDSMGVYTIPRFEVPLPIHMQWCKWCSENLSAPK